MQLHCLFIALLFSYLPLLSSGAPLPQSSSDLVARTLVLPDIGAPADFSAFLPKLTQPEPKQGASGAVFDIAGEPTHIAKKFFVNAANTEAAVQHEGQVLKLVGEFVRWGFVLNTEQKKQYIVVMKKHDGKALQSTNLYKKADAAARTALVEKVAKAAAEKVIAVAKAHHVLHNDVNTGNVLVTEKGDVAVIDWGSIKEVSEAQIPTLDALTKKIAAMLVIPGNTSSGSKSGSKRRSLRRRMPRI